MDCHAVDQTQLHEMHWKRAGGRFSACDPKVILLDKRGRNDSVQSKSHFHGARRVEQRIYTLERQAREWGFAWRFNDFLGGLEGQTWRNGLEQQLL
jgi:hypothetical protein